jgi:hypothetical protein
VTPIFDSFNVTMSGLEAGLRVEHIAAFDLQTCHSDDALNSVLTDKAFTDFDQIPVRDRTERIVGVLLRSSNSGTGSVAESMQKLDESILVSADGPLMSFVRLAGTAPYKLVLNEHGIRGIVTRSDLLKLPVRLLAFACVTHLEILMADLIRMEFADGPSSWLAKLSEGRQQKIREKETALKGARIEIDTLEFTDFCDKRDLADAAKGFGEEFVADMKIAEKLRNDIAHAATFITSDAEARQFAVKLQKIEGWIVKLQVHVNHKAQA